jgi:hypothetical protein
MRMTQRPEIGDMWLPWCVDLENRAAIVRIDAEPERRSQAMQLRVGDLADDDVRRALSIQVVRDDGRSSIDLIAECSERFRGLIASGRSVAMAPVGDVEVPAVFLTAQGPMLHEACHRVCGLYDARVEVFDLCVRVDELFAPWTIYDDPTLRKR